MEDRDLDKILKDKLKGKIVATPEMENKIKEKIEEQKRLYRKENNKKHKNNVLKPLISLAAVFLLIFTFTLNIDKFNTNDISNIFEKKSFVAVIKAIEPTKLSSGIIANDSEFIIQVDENSSKESIQRSLYIDPPLEYTIEETGNSNEYKLVFNQNIPDNTIIKLQYVKDKMTQNSWAYQTSNRLSVTNTYPNNDEDVVSKNTTIEIEFSYANIENFENNVSILPEVKGRWEHLGKIWRFVPNNELEEQKYIVTVDKGIKAGDEELKDSYSFNFTVSDEVDYEKCEYDTYSIDGINTYKSDEKVKIYYRWYQEKLPDISKVEISKFDSIDEFMEYLETNNTEKAESIGDYKFSINDGYIELNNSLQNGYYVASVKNSKEKEMFNCPIQINSLNAYAVETEKDVLIWVADEKGLAKDIKVEYSGKEQKTDSSGIANFEGVADGSESIKYAQIGNDENKLVVGFYNYKFDNYPSSYLYTDRPVYKNTDTIKIWGFIPRKLFHDKIEDEFYLELGNEGKQKVKIEEDGNFNYEINLQNHIDEEYCSLGLYYKDVMIAWRNVYIENYELQNYTYEIISDKNYAFTNTIYEFDVRVKHITGLVVPNKSVSVKFGSEILRGVTSEDGLAHFSIKINDDLGNNDGYVYSREIDVYNGDIQEYTTAVEYKMIYLVPRSAQYNVERKEKKIFEISLHKLLEDKKVNVSYDLHEIYDVPYDTKINVILDEGVSKRYVDGYSYNEYTKKNEPQYRWAYTNNYSDITTIETSNGICSFDASNIEMKKDTEDTTYSYNLKFEFQDTNGKHTAAYGYLNNFEPYNLDKAGYYHDSFVEVGESSDEIYSIRMNIKNGLNTEAYYTYRYFLKMDNGNFSLGDKREFVLYESTDNGLKEIQNDGKLLRVIFKEDISKTDIIEDSKFEYTFSDKDFPGVKMTTAYYHDGKFYRMPVDYFDFNEKDRKTDIEIKADKEGYAPGDEVTITVKTTNNGKPVKSFVNISVVNEGIFEIEDDYTNILEEIYRDKSYPVYTYSSYIDFLKFGGGGGRWRPENQEEDLQIQLILKQFIQIVKERQQ